MEQASASASMVCARGARRVACFQFKRQNGQHTDGLLADIVHTANHTVSFVHRELGGLPKKSVRQGVPMRLDSG